VILVGTEHGVSELDGGPLLTGRRVVWLGARSVLTHGGDVIEIAPGDRTLTHVDDATCFARTQRGLFVGIARAHLVRDGGVGESFDGVPGRDHWYTPWGGPPDTRSIAEAADGSLHVNVHVRGIDPRRLRHAALAHAATGLRVWHFKTGGAIFSTAAVVDGVVYFGSEDHSVYALRASDGSLLWKRVLPNFVQSSPAVTTDTVYIGEEDGYLVALDRSTGAIEWRTKIGRYIVLESPVYANGVVYAASQQGGFAALDAATGERLWSWRNKKVLGASPAVIDGTAYFASSDGYLYAFRLAGREGRGGSHLVERRAESRRASP